MNVSSIKDVSTIVIGAGPAGLMAGSCIKGSAIILEKNRRAGLKLLISGSGQCNITHSGSVEEFLTHFGKKSLFLKPSLYEFSNKDTAGFFESENIHLITRDDGKVFPESFKSTDILNVLLKTVKSAGNSIEYNSTVKKVEKTDDGFMLKTDTGKYICSTLIISVGGKSYPSTGSTGDGYAFAEKLEHPVIKPLPGLSPVMINCHSLSSLSGISFSGISLSHWRDGKKLNNYSGDLLITHNGLSGPVILDNSRYFQSEDILKVEFADSRDNLIDFKNDIRKQGKQSLKKYLRKYNLPQRLTEKIVEISAASADKNCADLNNAVLKSIYSNLFSFPFSISAVGGFKTAMVTAGGVDLSFVNPKTMESKIHKGLYFAGEILDIDGDTGGYNLQAALSTGYKAAESINKQ
jgi:predicted Rossmann fold flavoprotein